MFQVGFVLLLQSWKKSSAGGCSRVNQWRHHHQSFEPARHFVSVLLLLEGISLCAAPKQRNRPKVTASPPLTTRR
jgi:hypothetical protein